MNVAFAFWAKIKIDSIIHVDNQKCKNKLIPKKGINPVVNAILKMSYMYSKNKNFTYKKSGQSKLFRTITC